MARQNVTGPTDRQRTIIRLSQEWGVTLPPAPTRLERPAQLPSYRTPNDDQVAEDLLQRHALEIAQIRPKSGLTRAFSSNNLKKGKNWEPQAVLQVLTSWIANSGTPGVAEALLVKLAASGVDLAGMQKQKQGILNRRRSLETFTDRTKLLRSAVERDLLETVQVLLPHADPLALDGSIPVAIKRSNAPMVELLLRFGAKVSQTAEGQDAFRQACAVHTMSEIVGLILQSDGRPSPELASQAMPDAVRAGCLDSVLHLSRTIADGNHNQAEALQFAARMGRRDIAIAIVMGNYPPGPQGLSEAFRILFGSQSHGPTTKLEIGELLLCAGAQGDILAQALHKACDSQFYDMVSLLSGYGVSIEYNDAAVVKTAISRGQVDLVHSLLNTTSSLNPTLASSCVGAIPQQISNQDRYVLLDLLLRKGAGGNPLSEKLIDATQAGDISSLDLLLKPFFPERGSRGSAQGLGAQASPSRRRHEVASPDYKDGEALRTAVLRVDTSMTQKILASQPSGDTLTKVFPLTKNLSAADRYDMVNLFLKGALAGPPLHAALQDAIGQDPSTRDVSLITLLLNYDADINYNHGEGLQAVILQQDMNLLETLMQRASPKTAAARVPGIMKVADHRVRHDMMALMLRAGAAVGIEEVSTALLETLKEKPVDMSLLRLLLQHGSANVNRPDNAIMTQTVRNPDPKVTDMVFNFGKPSPESITSALNEIVSLPSTDGKAWKLKVTLAKSTRAEDVSSLMVTEVQALLRNSSKQPSFAALKQLLDAGADPNAYKSAALTRAVAAANSPITDMLLECDKPPTSASLAASLPHSLRIPDPMDRLSFTKKLVLAGASPSEVNRALIHAITTYPNDQPLLEVLAKKADTSDGEALSLSVSKESAEALDLLLSRSKSTSEARNTALQKVLSIRDRAKRRRMCLGLLKNGVSEAVASRALQVAARDGDVELGDILIVHGANAFSDDGQAIIEACRGGSAEVLEVLFRMDGQTPQRTLEQGFQAATEIGDLNKRAVVFEKLLKKGVKGEAVDAQLLYAARYGEGGHEVLRVLLEAGADPNYSSGEAIVAATSIAIIGNLELLLGLWDQEGKQRRPSHPTLIRALKACWNLNRDTRFEIMTALFKAGMPATDDVHVALNQAVNETYPEERLVKLLLDNGASPTANDCKTLVDAARHTAAPCLGLVLEKPIPQEDINRAFTQSFTPDNFETWFSDSGMRTAQTLLDAGAQGYALSEMLLQVMGGCRSDTVQLADDFVELLVSHGPDVDYNAGAVLQQAASMAHVPWVRKLLECRPSSRTLSFAFQCIFDTLLDEEDALALFEIFTEYRDGETSIDVMAQAPGAEPVLVRAMSQYPRSTLILKTLLDAGYYHDQATWYRLHEDIEEAEEMTLLTWAIGQPQKKISSAVIQLLLERGANVNYEAKLSKSTPLMLAIQNRRPDLAKELLLEGADVDVTDYRGRTPLSMATEIGGELAIQMMGNLLAAEPSQNDGSLHNAARDLNLSAVKVLVQAGHDPDFPSTCHDGRSALGEVCLRASDNGEMTLQQEKTMQKVIMFLVESGADLELKSRGKSLLLLCFDAKEPVATTKVFLKAAMWKYVNKPFNCYTDGKFTYSPTMYISKVLKPSDSRDQLLELIRANRGIDVYYANEGPQPDDAIGLPKDMEVQERERKARLQRLAEEQEDFARTLARKRESANVEGQIWAQKAEMEEARRRRLHSDDLQAMRTRAQLEDSLGQQSHHRRLSEQRQLGDAATARLRSNAAAEMDIDDARQRKAIEWESRANTERVESARALGAVRISEREELDRLERSAENRMTKRFEQQRKLIEGQERLAQRLAAGPNGQASVDPRRQIGFVSEEVN